MRTDWKVIPLKILSAFLSVQDVHDALQAIETGSTDIDAKDKLTCRLTRQNNSTTFNGLLRHQP